MYLKRILILMIFSFLAFILEGTAWADERKVQILEQTIRQLSRPRARLKDILRKAKTSAEKQEIEAAVRSELARQKLNSDEINDSVFSAYNPGFFGGLFDEEWSLDFHRRIQDIASLQKALNAASLKMPADPETALQIEAANFLAGVRGTSGSLALSKSLVQSVRNPVQLKFLGKLVGTTRDWYDAESLSTELRPALRPVDSEPRMNFALAVVTGSRSTESLEDYSGWLKAIHNEASAKAAIFLYNSSREDGFHFYGTKMSTRSYTERTRIPDDSRSLLEIIDAQLGGPGGRYKYTDGPERVHTWEEQETTLSGAKVRRTYEDLIGSISTDDQVRVLKHAFKLRKTLAEGYPELLKMIPQIRSADQADQMIEAISNAISRTEQIRRIASGPPDIGNCLKAAALMAP